MPDAFKVKGADGTLYDIKDLSALASVSKSGSTITATTRGGTSSTFNLDEYTVAKLATAESGFIATYQLQKNGVAVGANINIPKDYLVKSATLETVTTADVPVSGYVVGDKYIDFVINSLGGDGNTTHLYLLVSDLIDTYTQGNGIQINNNTISAKVVTGTGLTVDANGITFTHPASGVTAGTYKSVTVNAQGHVTGGTNPTTLNGYGITDGVVSTKVYFTITNSYEAVPDFAEFIELETGDGVIGGEQTGVIGVEDRWVTAFPDVPYGYYLWLYIETTFSNGDVYRNTPFCVTDGPFRDRVIALEEALDDFEAIVDKSVECVKTYYSISGSYSHAPAYADFIAFESSDDVVSTEGGLELSVEDWASEMPVVPDGSYLWFMFETVYKDGSTYKNRPFCVTDANAHKKIADLDDAKVDKVTGKGLSKNDYSDEEKQKVDAFVDTGFSVVNGMLCVTYTEE